MRLHTLQPFQGTPATNRLRLQAGVHKQAGHLDLEFSLSGDKDQVFWPDVGRALRAKEELWKSTCFEVFINYESTKYLEWNLSPSREWYAYAFVAYRDLTSYDLQNFEPISLEREEENGSVTIIARLDLQRAFASLGFKYDGTQSLKLGLNAVLKIAGAPTYWALSHATPKPDFHQHAHFTIQL